MQHDIATTAWEIETREAPGCILEVLDADGVWRAVPHAAATFIRERAPKAPGFTFWEWWVGQVFAAGLFPPHGISSEPKPTDEEDDRIVRAFMDAYKARFPAQVKKFADYMGWKKPATLKDWPSMGWKPIETAPRDGTEILVWNGTSILVVTHAYDDDDGTPVWFPDARPYVRASHWMPLPPPPTHSK